MDDGDNELRQLRRPVAWPDRVSMEIRERPPAAVARDAVPDKLTKQSRRAGLWARLDRLSPTVI
jgi:hypothetical protein